MKNLIKKFGFGFKLNPRFNRYGIGTENITWEFPFSIVLFGFPVFVVAKVYKNFDGYEELVFTCINVLFFHKIVKKTN